MAAKSQMSCDVDSHFPRIVVNRSELLSKRDILRQVDTGACLRNLLNNEPAVPLPGSHESKRSPAVNSTLGLASPPRKIRISRLIRFGARNMRFILLYPKWVALAGGNLE